VNYLQIFFYKPLFLYRTDVFFIIFDILVAHTETKGMKIYKLPLCLLLMLFIGCGEKTTEKTDISRFDADSLAIVDKALKLRWERKYPEGIALLDSAFTLPYDNNGDGGSPDQLNHFEARRLASQAVRQLMFAFNSSKEYESGIIHLDSLLSLPKVLVSEECRRELLVSKAQMLQGLGKHADACLMLDSAMLLPSNDDLQSELFVTITAGVTYRWVDSTATKAEPALERAAEAMRHAGYDGTMLYPQAMANLAAIYMQKAQYKKSIDLCHEVIDICDRNYYIRGAIIATTNLSAMYDLLGSQEEAVRYNTLGLRYLQRDSTAYGLAGDLYLKRAVLLRDSCSRDSVQRIFAVADYNYGKARNLRGQLRVELERMNTWMNVPDSLPVILATYRKRYDEVPGYMQLFWHENYGKALMMSNRKKEAIPVFEKGLAIARKEEDKHREQDISRQLLECYLLEGKVAEAQELFPHYEAVNEAVAADTKIRELALANIHYETEKKEQRNVLLAAELALSKNANRFNIFCAIAVILLLLMFTGWLLARQRALRLKNEIAGKESEIAAKEAAISRERLSEKEKQLRRLITNRKELSDRNEELLRQLAKIQQESNNGCRLDTVMQSLLPSLLTPVEEELFRRQFAELYPSAVTRLREQLPTVSRQEELYAMLTLLNLNNKEIAQTLGINKDSVTKMRYRLRVKLSLPQGEDVDEYLKRIMSYDS